MKKVWMVLIAVSVAVATVSAQNDTRKQRRQNRKNKQDTARLHWQGDGKNWPADTIHRMINGKDSLNKF